MMFDVDPITGVKSVEGARLVRPYAPASAIDRRIVSFQDATYVAQIADGAAAGNGLLENLSDPANAAEIDASIVTFTGFSANAKRAAVQAHFNMNVASPESWLVLAILNAPDIQAARDIFSAGAVAIGDSTGVSSAGNPLGRTASTGPLYDLLSPTHPQIFYDLSGTDDVISRVHLLAIDSHGASLAESDLAVTVRVAP